MRRSKQTAHKRRSRLDKQEVPGPKLGLDGEGGGVSHHSSRKRAKREKRFVIEIVCVTMKFQPKQGQHKNHEQHRKLFVERKPANEPPG